MAQSFTDFRALPVGDFVSSDFVNASGTGVIEDNSYSEGNALVCGGSTWSGVVQVGLLHQAEVEFSVVCASTGSGEDQRAILVYSATADGYLTGSADYIGVRWFSEKLLAQGAFSGFVNTSSAAADGDILTLRVTPLTSGDVRAACLINGVEQFADDILAADVPAPDGDGNYYTAFTNRNGYSNSGIYSYGIGTNGDAAPTAPAAGPNTPVNPSITNLLATSARLNWEQG
jgi:hypothetical protein